MLDDLREVLEAGFREARSRLQPRRGTRCDGDRRRPEASRAGPGRATSIPRQRRPHPSGHFSAASTSPCGPCTGRRCAWKRTGRGLVRLLCESGRTSTLQQQDQTRLGRCRLAGWPNPRVGRAGAGGRRRGVDARRCGGGVVHLAAFRARGAGQAIPAQACACSDTS